MTIRHLKIFIEVYRCMNVTQAADHLHMTQPAVTRAVQEMERDYGVSLFDRLGRRLYRTESGEELYSYALRIVDSFDAMEQSMKNWDELGLLRVGGSITVGNFFLPPVVAAFQKLHPRLRVHVRISNGAQLKQALLDNETDLAVIEGAVSSEALCSSPVSTDRLVLILPPGHPLCKVKQVRMQDLVHYPLLLRENGSAGRTYLNYVFALQGLPVEPAWESVSTQALVKAVALGLGISLLPEQLVREDISSGKVATREIADEKLTRTTYLVWHREKHLTKAAQEFMELCRHPPVGGLPSGPSL